MRNTKKHLFRSALAMLLCFSMLLGTTFAWFTDSVTSAGNVISAGTLKVDLQHKVVTDEGEEWLSLKDNTDHKVFDYANWEPGFTLVESLKVVNMGTLALKYRLKGYIVSETVGENGERLSDVIDVYVYAGEPATAPTNFADIKASSDWTNMGTLSQVLTQSFVEGQLLPTGKVLEDGAPDSVKVTDNTVTFALHMREEAGNEYQNLGLGDLFMQLDATQWTYENDSFGNGYDADADYNGEYTASAPLNSSSVVDNGNNLQTTEDLSAGGDEDPVNAKIPAGTLFDKGTDEVKVTVKEIKEEDSTSGVTPGEDQSLKAIDVHVDGVSKDNTMPIIVTKKAHLDPGMNAANIELFHVEESGTNKMTVVLNKADLDEHNEFYYDPATGDVTMALASFSEVAAQYDNNPIWEGGYDFSWFTPGQGSYKIANADQLAAFGAIVGGMKNPNTGEYVYTDANGDHWYTFEGETVTLVADIDIGDITDEDGRDIVFYPIGAYNSTGSYDKFSGGSVTSSVCTFAGTFDGNGKTIKNFYQNTWEMFGDYNSGYSGTPNHYKDGMGLFGYVNGGTVKNLTVDNFKSDGEFTPTGVIAAYARNATFENIAILNCNPRVYNTGNGGIVGVGGDEDDDTDADRISFTNIMIDNTNKITALWGSWDVACGGLMGMFRGAGHVDMTNCHVSAQIDVFNDVCGNYQYYRYRYAGMLVGTNYNMITENGYTIPETDKYHLSGCSVDFGDWNNYWYCELVENSLASYTHDHQFSRLTIIESIDEIKVGENWIKTGDFVIPAENEEDATCYHIRTDSEGKLCERTHESKGTEIVNGQEILKEDRQHYLLPFNQLFTGYGWGVNHIPSLGFDGVTVRDAHGVVESKFYAKNYKTKYNVKEEAIEIGDLVGVTGKKVDLSAFSVQVFPLDENSTASATVAKHDTNWEHYSITFNPESRGAAKVVITDYSYYNRIEIILDEPDSVVKFELADDVEEKGVGTKEKPLGIYTKDARIVNLNALFAMLDYPEIAIRESDITVTITTESGDVAGTFVDGATFNEKEIEFTVADGAGGYIIVSITDGYYCTPTVIYIVVDPDFAPENPWLDGGDIGGGDDGDDGFWD